MKDFDIAIIGGGIVGLATAMYAISKSFIINRILY